MKLPPPDDNPTPALDAPSTPDQLRARLLDILRASGALHDPAVERALLTVPRHLFLPGVPIEQAYADVAIPTHWEGNVAVSSASQPAMVAIMLEQLQLAPDMNVLEIGAGTGYNAALMAELAGPLGHITTVDIDPEIVAEAREHLNAAGYPQVRVVAADGAAGWPDAAPYDRIILTVGAADVTSAWFEQLAEGGILLVPLLLNGTEASVAFRKRDGLLISESLAPCGFMRLRGAEAAAGQWVPLPDGRRLFAERAADLAAPVFSLLHTRPRRRFWAHPPTPSALQYLGLRGHAVLTLYTESAGLRPLGAASGGNPTAGVSQTPAASGALRQASQRRRLRGRWGIYIGAPDGPSLALFSDILPVLIAFGTPAAERILESELAGWQPATCQPLEGWRVVARPRATHEAAQPPDGAIRVTRRYFIFDIWPGS